MKTKIDNWEWEIDDTEILEPWFADFKSYSATASVKSNAQRDVFTVESGGKKYYIKYSHPISFLQKTRSKILSKSASEYHSAKLLEKAGIPTPKVVGWGKMGCDSMLISEEVANAVNARKYWFSISDNDISRCDKFLTDLAEFLKGFLNSGLYHPDFHPGNLLVTEKNDDSLSFTLIDPYGVVKMEPVSKTRFFEMLCIVGAFRGEINDSDTTPVIGQDFGYTFDTIGNRLKSTVGIPACESNYSPNNLNQYTSRTVPGIINILGTASTDAIVKIHRKSLGETAAAILDPDRDGKIFSKTITVDNSASAVTEEIDVYCFKTSPYEEIGEKESRTVTVPKSPQNFLHDDDGNLLSDGTRNYTWNAENRLVGVESSSSVPLENKIKLEFKYDYKGSRFEKKVSSWTGSAWQLDKTAKFAHDGWSLIGTFDAANNLQKSFLHGEEGILVETDHTESKSYLAMRDANRNIVGYVDSADGAEVASYEYNPFGKIIVKTGSKVDDMVMRFAGYFYDVETGLTYLGFRYYDWNVGRFLNRDPIGENGGEALYAYAMNDGVNAFDILGLQKSTDVNFSMLVSHDLNSSFIQHLYRHPIYKKFKKLKNGSGKCGNIFVGSASQTKIAKTLDDNHYVFVITLSAVYITNPYKNDYKGIASMTKKDELEVPHKYNGDISKYIAYLNNKLSSDLKQSQYKSKIKGRWRTLHRAWEKAATNQYGRKPYPEPVLPTSVQDLMIAATGFSKVYMNNIRSVIKPEKILTKPSTGRTNFYLATCYSGHLQAIKTQNVNITKMHNESNQMDMTTIMDWTLGKIKKLIKDEGVKRLEKLP